MYSLAPRVQKVLAANHPPANVGNRTFWQVWDAPTSTSENHIWCPIHCPPNPHTLATEALSLRGPQSWAAVPAGPVLGLRQQ